MKLISMTDFVLEQTKINQFRDDCEFAYPVRKYANFLKQPLELWMFIPCDDNVNVLEQCDDICSCECDKIKAFRKAKERCFFDGFEIRKMEGWNILDFPNNQYSKDFSVFEYAFKNLTIEDLLKHNLQLTQTAIKQLGL